MPKSLLHSKRAVAMAVVATLVGVSAGVLLSGQSTPARAAAAPGATVRASVVNGTNAESPRGGDEQELSADGTTVAFSSYAQLDSIKTADRENVYVRDLRNNKTVLISRGQFTRPPEPTGGPTPGPIGLAADPLVSLNGRRAQPPPLVYGETTPTGTSREPTISADGRFVAFVTRADNIVPADDDTEPDILVCDRDPDSDGVFDEPREDGTGLDYVYRRVNQPQYLSGEGGTYRVDYPNSPKLSDDASRIVWEDRFADANNQYHYVVRTSLLQAPAGGTIGTHAAAPGTVQIVDTPLGELAPLAQYYPDVSSNGQFIVLVGHYERPESDGEFYFYVPFQAVIRKDMTTGAVLRVDWDIDTTPEAATYLSEDETVELATPAISGNGGEIAFVAEEFHDSCDDGCWNSVANQPMVFVVRIGPNAAPVDSIVASRDNAGEIVNGIRPGLSGDGRFVAFGTDNLNTHDGVDTPVSDNDNCIIDTSDLRGKPLINLSGMPPTSEARNERTVCQVVVRDLVVDRDRLRNELPRLPGTLASAGTGTDCAEEIPDGGTCGGNDDSPPLRGTAPSLSHNGSTIAFDSRASNLVPDQVDDNGYTDVFVRTFRPELRADPTPLDFGVLTVGDTFDQVVRFDHVGLGPLVVTDIAIEGSTEFALGAQTCSGEGTILQQAGSCEVSVTFAPKLGADRTGTLRLTLRDGREFTVPLTGKGTQDQVRPDRGRFAAGPDPVNFGDRLLLSDGPTQTVTVTNVGDANLTITSVEFVSTIALADYKFVANTCANAVVPANGTCQVTIAFSPTAPADRPAVLRITDNGPGGVHLIGLSGKGSTPTVLLSPAVTQPARVVTVTGTGFAPNRPVTITITGSIETAKAFTDESGAFTQGLLILPKSPVGNRPVIATLDGTTLSAAIPLLIVTPSSSPGDFVARG